MEMAVDSGRLRDLALAGGVKLMFAFVSAVV